MLLAAGGVFVVVCCQNNAMNSKTVPRTMTHGIVVINETSSRAVRDTRIHVSEATKALWPST